MAPGVEFIVNTISGTLGIVTLFAPGAVAYGGLPLCAAFVAVFLAASLHSLRALADCHEGFAAARSLLQRRSIRLQAASSRELQHSLAIDAITGAPSATIASLAPALPGTSVATAARHAASSSNPPLAEMHTIVHFYLGGAFAAAYDFALLAYFGVALFLKFTVLTNLTFNLTRLYGGEVVTKNPLFSREAVLLFGVLLAAPIMLLSAAAFNKWRFACNVAACVGHASLLLFFVTLSLYGGPAQDTSAAPPNFALLTDPSVTPSSAAVLSVLMGAFGAAHFPQATTPAAIRSFGVIDGVAFHRAVEVSSAAYMLLLGALQIGVLPERFTAERILPFALLDAPQWVPAGPPMIFAVVGLTLPYFHVAVTIRSISEVLAGILCRLEGRLVDGDRASLTSRRKPLSWIVMLLGAQVAANAALRPYWLMAASISAIHLLYLASATVARRSALLRPAITRSNAVPFTVFAASIWILHGLYYLS